MAREEREIAVRFSSAGASEIATAIDRISASSRKAGDAVKTFDTKASGLRGTMRRLIGASAKLGRAFLTSGAIIARSAQGAARAMAILPITLNQTIELAGRAAQAFRGLVVGVLLAGDAVADTRHAFTRLAASMGGAEELLRKLEEATGREVDQMTLMAVTNRIMIRQIGLSADQMGELFAAIKKVAEATQQDFLPLLESVTGALVSGEIATAAQALGLEYLTEAELKALAGIQDTTEALSAQQRAATVLNLVVARAREITAALGEQQATAGDASARLAAQWQNLRNSLLLHLTTNEEVVAAMSNLSDQFTTATEQTSPLAQALGAVVAAGIRLASSLMPLVPTFAQLAQSIAPLIAAIAQQLAPVLSRLIPVFAKIIEAIMPVVVAIANALIPILEALAPVILQVARALAPFIERLSEMLLPIIQELLPPLQQLIEEGLELLMEIFKALMPVVKALIPPLIEIARILIQALKPVVKPLGKIFLALAEAIGPILTPILRAIMPLFELLAVNLGALEPMIKILAKTFEFLAKTIEIAMKPMSWFAKAIGWVVGKASEAVRWLGEKLGIISEESEEMATRSSAAFQQTGEAVDGLASKLDRLQAPRQVQIDTSGAIANLAATEAQARQTAAAMGAIAPGIRTPALPAAPPVTPRPAIAPAIRPPAAVTGLEALSEALQTMTNAIEETRRVLKEPKRVDLYLRGEPLSLDVSVRLIADVEELRQMLDARILQPLLAQVQAIRLQLSQQMLAFQDTVIAGAR